MNLSKKKKLAARALKVGVERVQFNIGRLDEIKEAITRQDIKDLVESRAIIIKLIKGRRKKIKRKTRRRMGSIKIKVKTRKQDYVILTRKLRTYLKALEKQGKIDNKMKKEIRKQIKNRFYKSRKALKESLKIK